MNPPLSTFPLHLHLFSPPNLSQLSEERLVDVPFRRAEVDANQSDRPLDTSTKKRFVEFCDEIGLSALSVINLCIKTIVRVLSSPRNPILG